MLYHILARPLLFRLDAEDAHHLTLRGLEAVGQLPLGAPLLNAVYGVPRSKALATTLWSLDFPSPIGLAAGLDKNGQAVAAFSRLGFGFMEVGTVTPRAQSGNDRPRLFRLPPDAALINRMGFNNAGMDALAARLGALTSRPVPVGVNLGKNKDTPLDRAEDDYRACVRALYPHADFFVVNVSSPNTPGLRGLQSGSDLARLLAAVRDELEAARVRSLRRPPPLLVKIAPDLGAADFEATVRAAAHADGLVVSNTTLGRDRLSHFHRAQGGGLSGKPLEARSTELIRRAYKLTDGALPIVGSGGVFTARDAYAKIRAGASLVEIYTALIYEGPGLPRRLNRELEALLRRDDFGNVSQAVGADHRSSGRR